MNTLFLSAKQKYINGYSQSRLVDYVYRNANSDEEATQILISLCLCNDILKNA